MKRGRFEADAAPLAEHLLRRLEPAVGRVVSEHEISALLAQYLCVDAWTAATAKRREVLRLFKRAPRADGSTRR